MAQAGVFSPCLISSTIAKGDSERGLSSVITSLSASFSATLPIKGRFPLSLSPPQPNTHQSLPLQWRFKATKAFSSASGVWA